MATQVTKYKAEDGTLFDTLAEAMEYEIATSLQINLAEFINRNVNAHGFYYEDAVDLSKLLLKHFEIGTKET